MKKLELEIPETCKNCSYLSSKVIDHNYYGEITRKTTCTIFKTPIKDFRPCQLCLQSRGNHDDVRKYADFLVKEINKMASETCNRTLDRILVKVVDVVQYQDENTPVVNFNDLKAIIDSLRE